MYFLVVDYIRLGPVALQELLGNFSKSFLHADCLQILYIAFVILILKAGKSASNLASYWPISLISCIAKLLESILADHIYYISELKHLFSCFQVGFQKQRGCKDQILQIVQAIEDCFQWKPMQRSVLVLLKFSKAYNVAWREQLLLHHGLHYCSYFT